MPKKFQKYPATRYHKTLAPKTITSEAEEAKGWQDTPFPAAGETPAKRAPKRRPLTKKTR